MTQLPPHEHASRFDGWIAGSLSVVFALGTSVLYSWENFAGSWTAFLSNWILDFLIVNVLLTCFAIIWTAIVFGILRRFLPGRRGHLICAISPFLILLSIAIIPVIKAPPFETTYFLRHFCTQLPETAHQIQIRPSTLYNAGHVSFYFESSPTEITSLIHRLQLEPLEEDTTKAAPISFSIPEIAEPNPSEVSWFIRVEPSGTRFILATKDTQVFLARDPLFSRFEDDFNNPNTPP